MRERMNKIGDCCQLRALTGIGFAEFDQLLPVFSTVYEAKWQKRHEQAGMRRRKPCSEAPSWSQEQARNDGGYVFCALLY